MLRLAACLEEHFPHSMANAVVEEAKQRGLTHDEFHSKVEYLVAHGIVSNVNGERVLIGSAHFVFEDEGCVIPPEDQARFDTLPEQYSHLFLAVGGELAAVICISDPVREEAASVLAALRNMGISKTVMLTGDAEQVADQVAEELGVDQVYSQLLPADKVEKVEELLARKRGKEKLAFVGDGINDAPVLGRADIGIAMGAMGSDAAIEAADVVLMDDDPMQIAKAIKISRKCLGIVYQNIVVAIGIKLLCLVLVALGFANMWLAVFADVGVMILAVLNAIRALFVKNL